MSPKNDVPIYGIDVEIKQRIDNKVSASQVEEARQWIEQVLQREFPKLDQPTLKDGTVLVELLQKVTGDNKYKIQRSNMPFKQMENIQTFLQASEKLGCPQFDLFQTIDLYEDKNFGQVILAIFSFARHAHKFGLAVPSLGPKLHQKHEVNFSDEKLNAGRNMPSMLTGGAGIIQPTGLIFGLPRQAINPNLEASCAPNVPTAQTMGSHGAQAPSASTNITGIPRQAVFKS